MRRDLELYVYGYALRAAEERAQRAERELAALKSVFLDKPEDRLWHDSDRTWWKRTEKGLVSAEPPSVVAEVLALAEEGRRWAKQEIADLEDIDRAAFRSVDWWRYERDELAEYWTTDDDMVEHIGLTDKGRERLAYLRGLVGEPNGEH